MANAPATTFTLIGGQFQIGDGGNPENFTTITQVHSCDFTGSKVDHDEITSADNIDGVKRYAPRLFDPGDCSVEILWNPNDPTHQQFYSAYLAGGTHDFKRINPGGFGTRSFNGIILSADHKQTLDKSTMMSVKIKISGPVVTTVPGA